MHAHDHTGPHDSSEPERVHLAVTTDHSGDQGKHHDQDVEVSVSEIGILKKSGVDEDFLGLIHPEFAPLIHCSQSGQPLAILRTVTPYKPLPFRQPLLRAPPANHSV